MASAYDVFFMLCDRIKLTKKGLVSILCVTDRGFPSDAKITSA